MHRGRRKPYRSSQLCTGYTAMEKESESQTANGAKKQRFRMAVRDYEKILEYIENPDNFASLQGKTRIGGQVQTKATAFGAMAVHLQNAGFPSLTGSVLQKKFERYVDSYRRARGILQSTGGGLTESEIAAGISLEQKLNARCPYFYRMHAVFGSRGNVDTPAVVSIGFQSRRTSTNAENGTRSKANRGGLELQVCKGDEGFGEENFHEDLEEETQAGDDFHRSSPNARSTAADSEEQLNTLPPPPPPAKKGNVNVSTLIATYQESLAQRSEFRRALLESKERYRNAMLEERRISERENAKRAKVDRRASLMIELSRAGKSTQEIKELIDMLSSIEENVDSTHST